MSHEDKSKGITGLIADEAKGVAIEVYKDGAKPSVVEVGDTLGRLIRLALRPLNLLMAGGERLMKAVERKLHAVPEDRLLPAPATIAAPAALQYALLGEGEDVAVLRELFENLLVTSMDRDTAPGVHPAFVSIISQLTADEAWILKSIDRDTYHYMELNAGGGFRTLFGADLKVGNDRLSVYITNLARIGLIAFHEGFADVYQNAPPELARIIEQEFPDEESRATKLRGGSLLTMHVTLFGRQFLDTCVRTR